MRLIKFLFLLLIIFLIINFTGIKLPFLNSANSLLKVGTSGLKSEVFLDGKSLGQTPYTGERLAPGDHDLRLESSINNQRVETSIKVTLTAQNLTAVNYDFGPRKRFSSGDIRTFREGEGISITTTPSGADVWFDGEKVGQGSLSLTTSNGIHKIKVVKAGYYTRELEVNVESGLKLVVEVFLSENPLPDVSEIERGQLSVFNIVSENSDLAAQPTEWAEGVFFYESSEKYLFDALIDQNGQVYYQNQSDWEVKIKDGKKVVVGYLLSPNSKSLTSAAQKTLGDLKAKLPTAAKKTSPKKIQILSTPTGTLNVRSGPGQNYPILGKVSPGESYALLGESNGWYKIKAGVTGWVSGQYAKKL